MKKITLLLFVFFLGWQANAQLFQVATCSGGISSNTYGPMNSVATANATNRTAVIYPSTQLAGLAGQVINGVYFKRMAASGTMGGTPNFKVYLKETAAADFGAAALDWATETAGATLVYDSNPAASAGSTAGWKSFPLATNFAYSGTQNLAVFMEYSNPGASTAIGWDYEYGSPCISTGNNNTTKYINNTTGTPGTSLTSSNYRRPQIAFDFVVTCPGVTGLNYANLTATSVDLTWVAGGAETSWHYVVQPSADPVPTSGTTIGTNSVVGVVLSPNTAYTAYVRAACGPGDNSVWKTITFTSPCSTFAVPATENFATYIPGCWQEADNGDLTAGPATFGASSWAADGFSNSGTTGAMKINIDATGDNDWILSPVYTIPVSGYEVKFDAAVTQWNGTGAPTTPWEADDFVEVLVSTGTTNWTVLYTYNDTNVPAVAGTTNIIDLDAYAGQNVRFAFRGVEGAANGGADIDFFVDNFEIRLTPACAEPVGLAVTNLTDMTADVSWSVTSGNYEYVLDQVAANPAGAGTPTTSTTYNASGLNPTTTYYFHVRTDCGAGIYSTWSTVSFTTLATPPANDNCGTASALTAGGVFTDNAVTGSTVGANTVTGLTYACQTNRANEVWYSVTVPASGTITVETQADGASPLTDTVISVFTGTCGALTEIACDDDTGTGNFSIVNITGQTPGNTLYIGVWRWGSATNGTFRLSAYDASLSTGSFDTAAFRAYPNPVKNVLNLSYSTEISSVEVYNMLGQKVMDKTLNVTEAQVDMSNLNTGNYIVKVNASGVTQTLKVIKQ